MSTNSIFLIYCELSGSRKPLRAEGYAGAFVTCIVAQDEILDAIREAARILEEDGYDVIDIDKAMRFDPEEWDDDEIIELVSEVRRDREPRYSRFNMWGH